MSILKKQNKPSMASPDHEHSYLPLQNNAIRTIFEPVEIGKDHALYRQREYMYMFCKCGEALMKEIEKHTIEE